MIASEYILNKKDIINLKINDSYSLHRIVYDLFPIKPSMKNEEQKNGSKGFSSSSAMVLMSLLIS